jgi:hypothetical protein
MGTLLEKLDDLHCYVIIKKRCYGGDEPPKLISDDKFNAKLKKEK